MSSNKMPSMLSSHTSSMTTKERLSRKLPLAKLPVIKLILLEIKYSPWKSNKRLGSISVIKLSILQFNSSKTVSSPKMFKILRNKRNWIQVIELDFTMRFFWTELSIETQTRWRSSVRFMSKTDRKVKHCSKGRSSLRL